MNSIKHVRTALGMPIASCIPIAMIVLTSLEAFAQKIEWAGHLSRTTYEKCNVEQLGMDAEGYTYAIGNYDGDSIDLDLLGGTSALLPSNPSNATMSYRNFIVKYDSTGKLIWYKSLLEYAQITGYISIDVAEDGDFLLTGKFLDSFDLSITGPPFMVYEFPGMDSLVRTGFVAMYNKDGQLKWHQKVVDTAGIGINLQGMLSPDKKVIARVHNCRGMSLDGTNNLFQSLPGDSYDNAFISFDSNGVYQYHQLLDGPGPGYFNYYLPRRFDFIGDSVIALISTTYGAVDLDPGPGEFIVGQTISNHSSTIAFYNYHTFDFLWGMEFIDSNNNWLEVADIKKIDQSLYVIAYMRQTEYTFEGPTSFTVQSSVSATNGTRCLLLKMSDNLLYQDHRLLDSELPHLLFQSLISHNDRPVVMGVSEGKSMYDLEPSESKEFMLCNWDQIPDYSNTSPYDRMVFFTEYDSNLNVLWTKGITDRGNSWGTHPAYAISGDRLVTSFSAIEMDTTDIDEDSSEFIVDQYDRGLMSLRICSNYESNPASEIITNDTVICSYDSVTIEANVNQAEWAWKSGCDFESFNDGSYTLEIQKDEQIVLYDRVQFGCLIPVDTVTITHQALPTLENISDTLICDDDSISIKAIGNFSEVRWRPGLNFTDSSSSITTFHPSGDTSFSVVVFDSIGCMNQDSFVIQLKPAPILNVFDTSVCASDTLTGIFSSSAFIHDWSPGIGITENGTINPLFHPDSAQAYHVIGTAENGCDMEDSIEIAVLEGPYLEVMDTTICSGDTILAPVSTNGISVNWNPSSGVSNPFLATPLLNPDSTTSYTVNAWSGNGCERSETLNIYVINQPTGQITFSGSGAIKTFEFNGNNVESSYWLVDGDTFSTQYLNLLVPSEGQFRVCILLQNECFEIMKCLMFIDGTPLGNESIANKPITIFPNPSTGLFHISNPSMQDGTISVYNLSGQLIMQRVTNSSMVDVDLSLHPTGIYAVEVRTPNSTAHFKVLKN